ncbi:MAG: adenylate/guanylate cyclase domain-containing protein [Chthoniobacterales bacterium]
MKRSLLWALIIGVLVGGLVLWLHASGYTNRLEMALSSVLSPADVTKLVSEKLQYALVPLLAFAVAWMTLETERRGKVALIVALFAIELVALVWVCGLFRFFFQPLPSILSTLLSLGAAVAFIAIAGAWANFAARRALERELAAAEAPPPIEVEEPVAVQQPVAAVAPPPKPAPRPVEKPSKRIEKPKPREAAAVAQASAYDVSAVVCDIGNKHDLADELEPQAYAELTTRFINYATRIFQESGAFIETAAGEGIVAIFGYPSAVEHNAEKATRVAMRVVEGFPNGNGQNGDSENVTVNAGVSSGRVIVAPLRSDSRSVLAAGEPIELARRFCIANRFYGSRVLIGPATFEMAGDALIARPIDFLSGVDVRERHEIYEPIALAENATSDALQRRDSFWNGVVLYREKRWAEAYAHFQRARLPDSEDPPLQLYLRRLEPLALQLTNAPLED